MAVMDEDLVLMERSVPPDPLSVRRARRDVFEALSSIGADDLAADAELVAAELLTNAMEQGSERTDLALRRSASRVSLTVADRGRHGDELPDVASWANVVDAAGTRGRGLAIVAALSEAVDVDRCSDGTAITCWWTVPAR